jgi:hypothetical protein
MDKLHCQPGDARCGGSGGGEKRSGHAGKPLPGPAPAAPEIVVCRLPRLPQNVLLPDAGLSRIVLADDEYRLLEYPWIGRCDNDNALRDSFDHTDAPFYMFPV